jgi:hypothetical protein
MDIKPLLLAALNDALACPDSGKSKGAIHHNRSKAFVEALAEHLREAYRNRPDVYVLSRGCSQYRAQFGLNELLYDILVCEAGTAKSLCCGSDITHVIRALWAIECEFATDLRKAMQDFNKLVIAASESKLFIGPQVTDEFSFLESLLPAAVYCSSGTSAALVPHPAAWRTGAPDVHLYVFDEGRAQWEPVCEGTFADREQFAEASPTG